MMIQKILIVGPIIAVRVIGMGLMSQVLVAVSEILVGGERHPAETLISLCNL